MNVVKKATLVEFVLTAVAYIILGIAAVVAVVMLIITVVQISTGHASEAVSALFVMGGAIVLGLLYAAMPLLGAVVAGYIKARTLAAQPADVLV